MLPEEYLERYLSARVVLYYNAQSAYNDEGTLTYMDAHWVELTKDRGDHLLIPVPAIRLIKLLEEARPANDSAMLLRAAGGPPPDEQRQIKP